MKIEAQPDREPGDRDQIPMAAASCLRSVKVLDSSASVEG